MSMIQDIKIKVQGLVKPALVLCASLGVISSLALAPTKLYASDASSPKVLELINGSEAVMNNNAKPDTNINVVINGEKQVLTDPIVMENGRVFLPVRNLGSLLGINIDYMANAKVAVAQNEKAYLELPLGYNQAVKDKKVILPIDANNKNTRVLNYSDRTYLPVRFMTENLGYQISFAEKTVYITTDGTTPVIPNKPSQPVNPTEPSKPSQPTTPVEVNEHGVVKIDKSKLNPGDPHNAENKKAFQAGRRPKNLKNIKMKDITRQSGMDDATWKQVQEQCARFPDNHAMLVSGKLSEMPKNLGSSKDGKEVNNPQLAALTRITKGPKGELRGGISGASLEIIFKDGTFSTPNNGDDMSIGYRNHKPFPGKTVNDIAFITIGGVGGYMFFPTGY